MNAIHRLHTLRMANDAVGYVLDEERPRFDRLKGRKENGTAPRAIAVHQLFQTPVTLAAKLAAALHLKPGARVLEPSAGLGRLLDAIQPYSPGEVVAVEIAPDCAAELYRQDRAGVILKQGDFLAIQPSQLGNFDAVIMNPPFTMRADITHILHARKFLKPGGRLAALCLNTWQRREQLQPLCETWEEIPAGAFRESGTEVATVLLTIQN